MKEKTITKGESTSKIGNSTKVNSKNGSNFNSEMVPIKLFVGGLSWQTTVDKLKEYFGQFGDITDVLLMKDPLTQRNRGFGFITFSNQDALGRVAAVPSHTLDGKKIDPKPATPKGKTKTLKPNKVFVGGVSQDCTEDEVKAYFSQFGSVRETVMLMDQQTRRHRGFGFITFDSEETVDRVCEIHFHVIKDKKVECKKAQSKEAVQTRTYMGNRLLLNVGAIPSLGMPAAMQSMTRNGLPAAMQTMPRHILPAAMPSFPSHPIQSMPGHLLPSGIQPVPGYTSQAFLHHHPPELTASHFSVSYGKLLNASAHPSYRYSPYSIPSMMPPPTGTAPPPPGAPPLPPPQRAPLLSPPQTGPLLPPTARQPNQSANSGIGMPPPPHTSINLASGAPPPPPKANQTTNSGVAPQTPTTILSNQVINTARATYEHLGTQGAGNAQVQYAGYNLANVDMTAFGNVDWSDNMLYGFPGVFY